jgi:hypothetical protein
MHLTMLHLWFYLLERSCHGSKFPCIIVLYCHDSIFLENYQFCQISSDFYVWVLSKHESYVICVLQLFATIILGTWSYLQVLGTSFFLRKSLGYFWYKWQRSEGAATLWVKNIKLLEQLLTKLNIIMVGEWLHVTRKDRKRTLHKNGLSFVKITYFLYSQVYPVLLFNFIGLEDPIVKWTLFLCLRHITLHPNFFLFADLYDRGLWN